MLEIDHVNIRSQAVDSMCAFYTTVFQLKAKHIPGTRLGFWLFYEDERTALIHLIASETAVLPQSPQIEHIGFRATGLKAMVSRLVQLGHPYTTAAHPDSELVRLNIHDPDGNRIHVDFPLSEGIDTAAHADDDR